VFEDPNIFDIHRSGAHKHISFGKGIHFCLGARMAREEARIVLEVLTERIPSLNMVAGQKLMTFPNITFRGPERMELTWDQ
jgi:cytochrome P450